MENNSENNNNDGQGICRKNLNGKSTKKLCTE